MRGRRNAVRMGRELTDGYLSMDERDALASDDEFVHLSIALHNLRYAKKSGGESDTPGGLLTSTESGLKTMVERRFEQIIPEGVEEVSA